MLDVSHIPTPNGSGEIFTFIAGGRGVGGAQYVPWFKPRGKSMINIVAVGSGGDGGNGLIGSASLAGGGGGGGSGTVVRLTMPLHLLPDVLYLWNGTSGGTADAMVSISTTNTAANTLVRAPAGGNGGNGTATPAGGAAGAAGAAATAATMPLGWAFATQVAGQAGIIGGAAVAAGALAIPTTGLIVTGGTGGGGLPAAAGTAGGAITGSGEIPSIAGGVGGSAATTPPTPGSRGFNPFRGDLLFGLGGTGGGSTHGAASGAGLVQASGGNGAPGCGGGGSGAALTGSAAGVPGKGGPAFYIITCW